MLARYEIWKKAAAGGSTPLLPKVSFQPTTAPVQTRVCRAEASIKGKINRLQIGDTAEVV